MAETTDLASNKGKDDMPKPMFNFGQSLDEVNDGMRDILYKTGKSHCNPKMECSVSGRDAFRLHTNAEDDRRLKDLPKKTSPSVNDSGTLLLFCQRSNPLGTSEDTRTTEYYIMDLETQRTWLFTNSGYHENLTWFDNDRILWTTRSGSTTEF